MKRSWFRRVLRRLINLNLNYVLLKLGLRRDEFSPDPQQASLLADFFSAAEVTDLTSRPRFTEGTVEFRNCRIRYTDNAALVSMINEIFVRTNYRYTPTRQPLIVDCGANIGVSVLYFKKAYPDSRIVAVEADPYIYRILLENISANKLESVTALNRAVWTDEQTLNFVSDRSWGGHLELAPTSPAETVSVQGIDLVSLLGDEVDFLKMDLEGAEATVILHAREMIAKRVRNFFFEYHSLSDHDQQLGEILSYFEKHGFRYHIKEALPKAAPFIEKRRTSRMDCQLDVFLYRNGV